MHGAGAAGRTRDERTVFRVELGARVIGFGEEALATQGQTHTVEANERIVGRDQHAGHREEWVRGVGGDREGRRSARHDRRAGRLDIEDARSATEQRGKRTVVTVFGEQLQLHRRGCAELEDGGRRCMRGKHRRREDLGAGQVRDRDVERRHYRSRLALGVGGGQEECRPRQGGGSGGGEQERLHRDVGSEFGGTDAGAGCSTVEAHPPRPRR